MFTIGFFGDLTLAKGADLFCQVAANVRSHSLNIRFVLAGDGHLRKILEDQFQHDVLFLGKVEDAASFFNSIDILLITSRMEESTYAVLMALTVGIPILGITREEIQDFLNGKHLPYLRTIQSMREITNEILSSCVALNPTHNTKDVFTRS